MAKDLENMVVFFKFFAAFLRLSANFLNSVSQAFISSYFLFMNNGNDVFLLGWLGRDGLLSKTFVRKIKIESDYLL